MGGMKRRLGVEILSGVARNRQDCIADKKTEKPQEQMHADGLPLPQDRQSIHQQSGTKDDQRIEECKGHAHAAPVFMNRAMNLDLAGCEMGHLRECLWFYNYLRGSGHHSLLPEYPGSNLIS